MFIYPKEGLLFVMAKFNRAAGQPPGGRLTSPVQSAETTPSLVTGEGAPGFARNPKSETFLLTVGGFLGGEKTFYESGDERDELFRLLIRELSVTDPIWVAGFVKWLRTDANMRTASLIAAAEYVWARRDEQGSGRTGTVHPTPLISTRQVVSSVLRRADEPGEMIGYWNAHYGRQIPKPMKRGIADAVRYLYNEYNVLKYDSPKSNFRMADVLNLVHASPDSAKESALFDYLMVRRYGREGYEVNPELGMIRMREEIMDIPVEDRRTFMLARPYALAEAGMTWESLAGWLQGPMDAAAWQTAIPTMGYMAKLRNLRNFDKAGVSSEVADVVSRQIADLDNVASSRQLPFRFYSAYKSTSTFRWHDALQKALDHSLVNVPSLRGHTLILVDRSISMFSRLSTKSDMTFAEQAAIFGSALAKRAEAATLVQFGDSSRLVEFSNTTPLLRMADKFARMGGTDTPRAVRQWFKSGVHTRVIIVTDEQYGYGFSSYRDRENWVDSIVPKDVPVYTWNLVGYRAGHGLSGQGNRHTFGGLTPEAFSLISMLEAGINADWPWTKK